MKRMTGIGWCGAGTLEGEVTEAGCVGLRAGAYGSKRGIAPESELPDG